MNHFQRYLADEFAEDYEEGRLTRRDALKLIASVTGSMLIANSILAACAAPPDEATPAAVASNTPQIADTSGETATPAAVEPTATQGTGDTASPTSQSAQAGGTVSPDDPAVAGEDIQFQDNTGATLMAYLARPSQEEAAPVVLVCHENRGLTDHLKDVARRLAKAGYVALAVDLLSRQGGTGVVGSENVPGALSGMPAEQYSQDFISGWMYLQNQPFAQADRVGMVGFCFGGGVTWQTATKMPELRAAVPFYGPHPPLEDVPNIQAAVLAIYGELDQRINQGIPAIEEAMLANNKIFEKVIYPDADHAFHNDTGTRYNAEAAQDAWARTLDWFEQYLRAL